jgi:hypothetical protein
MREVFNHTSHDVEMEALPWARAYRVAKEQGNTIIFNIARTANREKQFKWIGKITEVLFSNLFRCDLNFSVVVLLILITLLSPHCTL